MWSNKLADPYAYFLSYHCSTHDHQSLLLGGFRSVSQLLTHLLLLGMHLAQPRTSDLEARMNAGYHLDTLSSFPVEPSEGSRTSLVRSGCSCGLHRPSPEQVSVTDRQIAVVRILPLGCCLWQVLSPEVLHCTVASHQGKSMRSKSLE